MVGALAHLNLIIRQSLKAKKNFPLRPGLKPRKEFRARTQSHITKITRQSAIQAALNTRTRVVLAVFEATP